MLPNWWMRALVQLDPVRTNMRRVILMAPPIGKCICVTADVTRQASFGRNPSIFRHDAQQTMHKDFCGQGMHGTIHAGVFHFECRLSTSVYL